jgi:anti-sigma-K factor RskA
MSRNHDRIEELLAVRALGGLDGEDVADLDRMLADHGDCEECRALDAASTATASALAMALDPLEVDPAMPERILADHAAEPEVRDDLAARRDREGPRWLAVAAVAAVVVLVAGSLAVIRNGSDDPPSNPAQRLVTFEGSDTATLAMAFVPGQSGVIFWGEGLPDPGQGQTYEIWMIEDDEPISGGCVSPTDGRVAAYVDADVTTAEQMAVTVEPASCPHDAPTGEIVLSATL